MCQPAISPFLLGLCSRPVTDWPPRLRLCYALWENLSSLHYPSSTGGSQRADQGTNVTTALLGARQEDTGIKMIVPCRHKCPHHPPSLVELHWCWCNGGRFPKTVQCTQGRRGWSRHTASPGQQIHPASCWSPLGSCCPRAKPSFCLQPQWK